MAALEVLRMVKINKAFPGVQALRNVDFNLNKGEVHALVGENGAGKSTLMNVLVGMLKKDSGQIFVNGNELDITSPAFAIRNYVGMVPQELNIVPQISVAENICMGVQSRKFGFILDWHDTYEKAKSIMDQLKLTVDPRKMAGSCSVAQLQRVQIGRALAFGARIIILDEPTSSLTYQEIIDLFNLINRLKGQGVGFIFITHHLDEVMEISDRVTVMRDGERVDTMNTAETDINEIIAKMSGHAIAFNKTDRKFDGGEIILRVKNLTHESDYSDVSFEVKRGEIFGVSGLVGAGRTEVMLTIFGSNPAKSGEIYFKERPVSIGSSREAINLGIGYLPEERRTQAIFPELSIRENLTIPILTRLFKNGRIDKREQRGIAKKYIDNFHIKTTSGEKQIRDLSGGNQQKVILARWIEKDMELLILDEPTRGIDVRAKDEIHKLIESLARAGKTIIIVSSEIEELLDISDRIMIMHEGRVKDIINANEASKRDILSRTLN
jgi:ABC-type sugar transport system ATPase subunit